MKTIISLVVLLAVQSAWCSTSEEVMENIQKQFLEKYIQRQMLLEKLEGLCPGNRDEFDVALTGSENCWLTADEESQTSCSIVKSHTSKCFEPIEKVLSECLPEKSRTIPKFVTDVVVAVADYICKTDGEHLFELFNKCARVPTYKSQRCLRRVVSKMQQQQTKPSSKSEVCEFLRSLKGCAESHLNASCGSKITREAFMDIFNIVLSKCDDSETSDENEVYGEHWKSKKENVDSNVQEFVEIL